MRLVNRIRKGLNFLLPKNKSFIYAMPHPNCRTDFYDLLNANSDNLLCVINEMLENEYDKKIVVYLEYFDISRKIALQNYIVNYKQNNKITVKLILSHSVHREPRRKWVMIVNSFYRYRCSIWMADTISSFINDKVSRQKLICLNYSTPFKMYPRVMDFSFIDFSVETSLLAASIHSSLYRIRLENSYCLGFPRNDSLFTSNKKESVLSWLSKNTRTSFKHLIIYVPTYRDYYGAFSNSIFGFDVNSLEMEGFLRENNIVVVVKYHPLQELNEKHSFSKHVIPYLKSYSFSLYDLLSISDALISDYSSVMHDYILTDRPIILNLFDEERFRASRGYSFNPIDWVLPGKTVQNFDQFKQEILKVVGGEYKNDQNIYLKNIFHKHMDEYSTSRVANFVLSVSAQEDIKREFLDE